MKALPINCTLKQSPAGRAAAANLLAVARALEAKPIPAPPSG
ncbi:MAG TPA: hypothetical protein VFY48_04965 [Solirubrobacterales bacterium]|nr:hypothetical protein [Solirubrobacterales bacterium]